MVKKVAVISDALLLFFLSVKIEVCNRLVTRLFLKRRGLWLSCVLDKKLQRYRENFSLLEERLSALGKSPYVN